MSKSSDHDSNETDSQVYEVEKIIEKKLEAGQVLYLVKWKNYPTSDNSWEPTSNLANCKELIKQFNSKQKEQQAKKTPPSVSVKQQLSPKESPIPATKPDNFKNSKSNQKDNTPSKAIGSSAIKKNDVVVGSKRKQPMNVIQDDEVTDADKEYSQMLEIMKKKKLKFNEGSSENEKKKKEGSDEKGLTQQELLLKQVDDMKKQISDNQIEEEKKKKPTAPTTGSSKNNKKKETAQKLIGKKNETQSLKENDQAKNQILLKENTKPQIQKDKENNATVQDEEFKTPGAKRLEEQKTLIKNYTESMQKLDLIPQNAHFAHGDEVEKIISATSLEVDNQFQIQLQLQWKKRPDGYQPENSTMYSKEFIKFEPATLALFYESKVQGKKAQSAQHQQQQNKDNLASKEQKQIVNSQVELNKNQSQKKTDKPNEEKKIQQQPQKIIDIEENDDIEDVSDKSSSNKDSKNNNTSESLILEMINLTYSTTQFTIDQILETFQGKLMKNEMEQAYFF